VRRPAAHRQHVRHLLAARPERVRAPRVAPEPEVEHQRQLVVAAVVRQPPPGVVHAHLADQHSPRVLVHHRADAAQHLVHEGVAHAPVLPVVQLRGDPQVRDVGRVVPQQRVLAEPVRGVDAEAVHPAVQPEPQHLVHRLAHGRVAPVEVRLLGRVRVQVVLAGGRVEGPRGADAREGGQPVGRRAAVRCRVAPHVEVPVGVVAGAARLLEPRVLVRRVVRHVVEQHAQPAPVRLLDQVLGVRERAEPRVDVAVVGDVVAEVDHRRPVDRGQPDRVDAQAAGSAGEVVQALHDAAQVPRAVPVGVHEAQRVDLVHGGVAPPLGRDHPAIEPPVRRCRASDPARVAACRRATRRIGQCLCAAPLVHVQRAYAARNKAGCGPSIRHPCAAAGTSRVNGSARSRSTPNVPGAQVR
jgi:hypothetical protein